MLSFIIPLIALFLFAPTLSLSANTFVFTAIHVKSYPAAGAAFRHDQVQLPWFGGLTGVQARRLTPDAGYCTRA